MHFIGMLGFELPVPVSYDVFLTLVSLAIAILAAALAFWWVSGRAERAPSVIVGGMLVGCGIAAMHYVGMAAMKIEPPIRYDPALFGLSIVVAVSASAAALCGAFELRGETLFSALWKKAGSAVIMGTAIYGMHYTGMAAAHFAPGAVSAVTAQHFDHVSLATALGAFTLLFLLGTLLMSAFDAYAGARALMHTRERLSDDLRRHMTELATAVAREINQPLAAMSANAGAAQRWISGEKPNTNEAKNALHRIGADATRAAQVIGRIRAFLGGSEGRRAPVEMHALVNEVLADTADKARRNRVEIRVKCRADLPRACGDAAQLRHVLLALVDNAIDAMADVNGRERLMQIDCHEQEADSVAISVRDSGAGIPEHNRDRVFDAFHTMKPGALGMGLAISRSLVEAHGGRLWLTPNERHGVTFHVSLPAAS